MKTIRTDEVFETHGKWWLPGTTDKIAGVLRFDPKSAGTLNLSGSFTFADQQDVLEKSFVSGFPSYPIIFGEGSDGTPITLFDSWIQRPSVDAEGVFANTALVGHRCKDKVSPFYDAIRLRLHNLEQWFEHCAFTQETKFTDHSSLTATLKESAVLEITGDLPSIEAKLQFLRGLTGTIKPHGVSCEYQTELWIRFNKPQSLTTCCEVAAKLQNLFTLLMGGPTWRYEFQLVRNNKLHRATFLASWRANVRLREIWNGQMPCSYQTIAADFVSILDGWFRNYEPLDLVITLLFEVLQVRGAVLEEKFFNLAQALEGFCAKTIPFEYEPPDKFEQFRLALIAAIPEGTDQGLRDRTKSWLKFANNPSLKGYISRLFRSLDSKVKANVLGEWKEGEFIDYVKDTRNIITHPSNGSVWTFTDKGKFRDAMDRLKLLLIVTLLQRAGVPLNVLQDKFDDAGGWTWG